MKIFTLFCSFALVLLVTAKPNPQYGSGYNNNYGKLNGGYHGPQQAVLYSINNDHYLLRLLKDLEKVEGNEVNYLVNSKIKEGNDEMHSSTTTPAPSSTPSSSSSSSSSSSASTTEINTTVDGDSSSSASSSSSSSAAPASSTTIAPTSSPQTPKSECEIVVGKNAFAMNKVAYYDVPQDINKDYNSMYKDMILYQPPLHYRPANTY